MKVITIDFETYYDKKFSLSKLTTEEYIRSPEFEVIGVAVKVVDGDYHKSHADAVWKSDNFFEIKKFLNGFDWENSIAVAHNAVFDMAILSWHFDIQPKKIADTLSMARALHGMEVSGSLAAMAKYYDLGEKGTEIVNALGLRRAQFGAMELQKYGDYCINDVELTYKLFLEMLPAFHITGELDLIDLTVRMFTEPVLELDRSILQTRLSSIEAEKHTLMDDADITKEELMSNDKFATQLKRLGVEPPTKISPTTGNVTWAFAKTDEDFRAMMDHHNTTVQALVAARLGVKSTIEESRINRLLEIGTRGTLPIPLRYYAAHTGRWGGDDKINMQNLPRSSVLKKAMLAPPGYSFLDCDSSQIEARTLAWLSGQDDLVQAFQDGEDVYKIMANQIYGGDIEDINDAQRFVGKQTILGCGYGMGALKFRSQLRNWGVNFDQVECQHNINVYRNTYTNIPRLWNTANRMLTAIMLDKYAEFGRDNLLKVEGKKGIRLPNDMYLKYPNLRVVASDDGRDEMVYDYKRGRSTNVTRVYGGKVVENVCQALARIIIGEQMLRISRKFKVVMTVHDAVGCIIPHGQEETAFEFVQLAMRLRPAWAPDLPLDCEGGVGPSYGEAK